MKIKNYFAVALASLALVACDNEDNVINDVEQGKAYVNISIALNDPSMTKAADTQDPNAEEVEAKVNSIDVYLENAGTATGYTCIATLTPADFNAPTAGASSGEKKYSIKQPISVSGTAGDNTRHLFVVINKPLSFNPATIASNGVFESTIQELTNTTNGFTMFNTAEVRATLHASTSAATASPTEVKVERLAAKALLTTQYDFTKDISDDNPGGAAGVFLKNTLKWHIQNSNKKMYYIKQSDYKDPNWEYIKNTTIFSDYELNPWVTPSNPQGTIPVVKAGESTPTGYSETNGTAIAHVQYFTENTNEKYVYGNTTLMIIEAQFVPSKIAIAYTDNEFSMDKEANQTPLTFYYDVLDKIYMTENAHTAYKAAKPSAEVWGPYTDGKCYYQVPIGTSPLDKTELLGAKRNHFYKGNITKLIAPGLPNPTPDPDEPVIKDNVWITVDLTIEPWNLVSMGNLELK